MPNFLKIYRKRALTDLGLLLIALAPTFAAFHFDKTGITKDAFLRSGALMALFGAFLDSRTHEIQALRDRDSFHRLWAIIGVLTEGLANIDRAAKYSLRSISIIISAAGMEPEIGKAEEIKDMVVTEKIKALAFLPIVPEIYYTYSKYAALTGKALVVSGTIIWAFGDYFVKLI